MGSHRRKRAAIKRNVPKVNLSFWEGALVEIDTILLSISDWIHIFNKWKVFFMKLQVKVLDFVTSGKDSLLDLHQCVEKKFVALQIKDKIVNQNREQVEEKVKQHRSEWQTSRLEPPDLRNMTAKERRELYGKRKECNRIVAELHEETLNLKSEWDSLKTKLEQSLGLLIILESKLLLLARLRAFGQDGLNVV